AQQGLPVLLLAPTMNDSAERSDGPSVGARFIAPPERGGANPETSDDALLHHTRIATRDYTNGEALKLTQELLNTEATVVESVGEALEAVKQCVILGKKNDSVASTRDTTSM